MMPLRRQLETEERVIETSAAPTTLMPLELPTRSSSRPVTSTQIRPPAAAAPAAAEVGPTMETRPG